MVVNPGGVALDLLLTDASIGRKAGRHYRAGIADALADHLGYRMGKHGNALPYTLGRNHAAHGSGCVPGCLLDGGPWLGGDILQAMDGRGIGLDDLITLPGDRVVLGYARNEVRRRLAGSTNPLPNGLHSGGLKPARPVFLGLVSFLVRDETRRVRGVAIRDEWHADSSRVLARESAMLGANSYCQVPETPPTIILSPALILPALYAASASAGVANELPAALP